MNLYIKGEVLDGDNKYNCEKYDRKISIVKRTTLKELPNTLIIHLKRFDFDYNTFEKIKLNNYFEFPENIDFKPWMRSTILAQNAEGIDIKNIPLDINEYEETNYELSGILVHLGTSADGGHYFSYIKIDGTWYEFNDSVVSEFNAKDIKYNCYGGLKDEIGSAYDRVQSAYLLFYTKKSMVEYNFETVESKKVEEKLLEKVKQKNEIFLKYKSYFDQDYFNFMKEVIDYNSTKIVPEKLPKKYNNY